MKKAKKSVMKVVRKVEGVEVCPYCEAEVEFAVNPDVSWMKCPDCGNVLVLCDKCLTDLYNEGKTEADQKCHQCPICRKAYLEGFIRGLADFEDVIRSYDVTDTTTGIDDGLEIFPNHYKDDSLRNADGSKPLYDAMYWDMVIVLDTWRRNGYDKPVDEIDKILFERATK